jgi:serine/threonine-protein phosphatase 4 regulatory subunit 1
LSLEETVYSSSTSTISVQAFTPILGTLLLNSKVGGAARYVVVNLLARMRKLNDRESGSPPPALASVSDPGSEVDEAEEDIPIGLFGWEERLMFEQELLQQVVIGMGRLDVDTEDDVDLYGGHVRQEDSWNRHSGDSLVQVTGLDEEEAGGEPRVTSPTEPEKRNDETRPAGENVNPYFPVLPPYRPATSPGTTSPSSSNSSTPSTVTDSSSSSSPSSNASDTPPSAPPPKPIPQPLGDVTPPPDANISPAQESPKPQSPSTAQSPTSMFHASSSDTGTDEHGGTEGTDDGEGDQASVGRLSSMSLMAAVTANGKFSSLSLVCVAELRQEDAPMRTPSTHS